MSMGKKKYKQDSVEQVRTEANKRRGSGEERTDGKQTEEERHEERDKSEEREDTREQLELLKHTLLREYEKVKTTFVSGVPSQPVKEIAEKTRC